MQLAPHAKSRSARIDPALIWLTLACALFGIRAIFFGWLLSPSLRVMLGMRSSELFGPVPANTVALEDPLLLLAAIAALVMAWRSHRQFVR
jgi:hypothetical protein